MIDAMKIGAVLLCSLSPALARDHGQYANSELKPWFDSLKSDKGACCSDADGTALSDVDWKSEEGHYTVRIQRQWINVPDDAVLKVPNLSGRTMVWPIYADGSVKSIRCFIAGPMG